MYFRVRFPSAPYCTTEYAQPHKWAHSINLTTEYALPEWAHSMRMNAKEIVALALLLGVSVSDLEAGFAAFSMDFENELNVKMEESV